MQYWNTHDHSREIYKSITSANGGNYAGQYPWDDCVDNPEPTLLIYYYSHSETPSEKNHHLKGKKKLIFCTENRVSHIFSEFIYYFSMFFQSGFLGDRCLQSTFNLSAFLSRYAVLFCTNTKYSKDPGATGAGDRRGRIYSNFFIFRIVWIRG